MKLFSAVLSINLCNVKRKILRIAEHRARGCRVRSKNATYLLSSPLLFCSLVPGARVSPFEAVLALRERLHFWQVRVLLERQRLGHHDRLLQQLLQDVRSELQEGGHLRGVQGNRETQNHSEAPEGTSLRNSEPWLIDILLQSSMKIEKLFIVLVQRSMVVYVLNVAVI